MNEQGTDWSIIGLIAGWGAFVVSVINMLLQRSKYSDERESVRENFGREIGALQQRDQDQTLRIDKIEAKLESQGDKISEITNQLAHMDANLEGVKETTTRTLAVVEEMRRAGK